MSTSSGSKLEKDLDKLEKLVQGLEGGELSLEDGIKKFEEGVRLYKSCREKLTKFEKKVTELTDGLKEEEVEF